MKSSSTLFPIVLSLREQGVLKKAVVPKEAMRYLSYINGIEFIAVDNLIEAIDIFKSGKFERSSYEKPKYGAERININGKDYLYKREIDLNFLDIRGQIVAKRASLIAVAGMHNFIMEGSPGSGKSMIAKRLREILPPISEEEMLIVAKHQFLDGETPKFIPERPFRSPHHTSTSSSILEVEQVGLKLGRLHWQIRVSYF